jgi:malate synthase
MTSQSQQTERVTAGGLKVSATLYNFVTDTVLPRVGVDADTFWAGFGEIVAKHTPRNRELLAVRDDLQAKLDQWYTEHPGNQDAEEYTAFLKEIGYLVDEPGDFEITTQNVDTEISETAGPQLVVPILNARFALNAANARWGSLYDALYGTDVISRGKRCGEGQGVQQGPRRQGHRLGTRLPRPGRAAGVRLPRRRREVRRLLRPLRRRHRRQRGPPAGA